MYFNFTFSYVYSNFLFARALKRRNVIFLFLFNFEGNSKMNTKNLVFICLSFIEPSYFNVHLLWEKSH